MIDVLLVNPGEKGAFFEAMPPLGLAYIAANLEKHGYSVKILDFEVEEKGLSYWLSKWQPKYVGISGTSHTRFESFRLASEIKKFNREIVVIYGGVHATFTAFDTLTHIKDMDYVVRGEGEQILVELIDALNNKKNLDGVRGISYRTDEGIKENPAAPRVEPLDSLPRPAYHLLDMKRYSLDMEFVHKKGISLITSRGCLAKCSFCSASRMFNHQLTVHSAGRILDEIDFLFDNYGFKGVKIFDSTLTMRRNHIEELCDEILRRKRSFPWECEIRVGTVDRAILEKMKEAGCYYVNFGVESGSQRVLNLMRKGFTVEQAEELLNLCFDVGLKTKVFFSFGHIGENMEDVRKTFRFIDKYSDKITTVASGAGVRIYPGTYLEEYARKNGLLPEDFSWSMPFTEKRARRILQSESIPLLLQPQLGFPELEDIALEIYRRRFKGWKGLGRGLRKILDREKWGKLFQLLKIKLERIFTGGSK